MHYLLSRGRFEFKVSQANDPTLRLSGLARLRKKRCMCFDNWEIMILKDYIWMHVCAQGVKVSRPALAKGVNM